MALRNGRRREGSVKGARLLRVHRSAAETLDGFFPPLPSPLPEAGALDEERKLVHFLIAVRSYARKGRALRGRNRPAWMGSGKRRQDRRLQRGKGGAPFPSKQVGGKTLIVSVPGLLISASQICLGIYPTSDTIAGILGRKRRLRVQSVRSRGVSEEDSKMPQSFYSRVCWNSAGWTHPTGEAAKLELGSYVTK